MSLYFRPSLKQNRPHVTSAANTHDNIVLRANRVIALPTREGRSVRGRDGNEAFETVYAGALKLVSSRSLSFRCPPERVPELIWIRTPLLDPNLGGVIPGAESPGRVLALYHPLVSSPAVQRSPLPQKLTAILSSLVNRPNRNRPAPPSPPQRTSPRSPSPSRSSRPLRVGARCTARRPQTQGRC